MLQRGLLADIAGLNALPLPPRPDYHSFLLQNTLGSRLIPPQLQIRNEASIATGNALLLSALRGEQNSFQLPINLGVPAASTNSAFAQATLLSRAMNTAGPSAQVGNNAEFMAQLTARALGNNTSESTTNLLGGTALPSSPSAVLNPHLSALRTTSSTASPSSFQAKVRGFSVPLACPRDAEVLSEYQALLRDQILLFEATKEDIKANAQGRNKPIRKGQVGIICKHCAHLNPKYRSRGATYFPAKMSGIYQVRARALNTKTVDNSAYYLILLTESVSYSPHKICREIILMTPVGTYLNLFVRC
jgi:hypothetical protein